MRTAVVVEGSWLSVCNFRPDNLVCVRGVGVPVTRSLNRSWQRHNTCHLIFIITVFNRWKWSTEKKKYEFTSEPPAASSLETVQKERARNNDISIPVAVERVDLCLGSLHVSEGLTGVRTPRPCYGTLTHSTHPPFSHRHHSNTDCPDGPLFSTLWSCGVSLVPEGADHQGSLVSVAIQLWGAAWKLDTWL